MAARKLVLPLAFAGAFFLGSAATWLLLKATPVPAGSKAAVVTSPKAAAPAVPKPAGTEPAFKPPVREVLLPQPRELSQVMDVLRTDFADAPALVGVELDGKKIEEIFKSPAARVKLLEPETPEAKGAKTFSELLPGKILYWRVPAFNKQDIDALAAQWEQIKAQSPLGLVLDLRDTKTAQDFAGSADLAALFAPPDTTLFSVQGLKIPQQVLRAQRQPLDFGSPFPIVVVVNSETRGAAEVLAGLLQNRAGAVVVGSLTAGEAGPNTDVKLKSGRVLRLATGRVVTAGGQEISYGPVVPDVELNVNAEQDRKAMLAAAEGVAATIAEIPLRKRQNEASLINDENPEIDEILEEQKARKAPKPKTVPQDATLHRAVDVLQGIKLYLQPPPRRAA